MTSLLNPEGKEDVPKLVETLVPLLLYVDNVILMSLSKTSLRDNFRKTKFIAFTRCT